MRDTHTVCRCCCCSVIKSCPALCDPVHCSPPGSSVRVVSQQEYWSGLPFPSPGELPHSGIEPVSPALTGGFFTAERPGNPGGAFASMETRVLVSPLSVHPLSNSTLAPELSPSPDAHSPRDYVCLQASFFTLYTAPLIRTNFPFIENLHFQRKGVY